jgi:hypothetical protein
MAYIKLEKNDLALQDLDAVVKARPNDGLGYMIRAPLRAAKGDLKGFFDDMSKGATLGSSNE